MKKQLMIIPVLLIAAVMVSGCVGQSTEVTTSTIDGIVIKALTAEPGSVMNDERVDLTIWIQNLGAVDARNVDVELLNVQNQWRNGTSPYDIITQPRIKHYDSLKAPQADQGIEGGDKQIPIGLMPPNDIPAGTPATPYPVGAKISYDYKTTGTIDITAYEYTYWVNVLKGTAPANSQIATVYSSGAPVQLSLDPEYITSPIIVNFVDEDVYTKNFKIVFTNVGSGYPIQEYGKITGTFTTNGAFKFAECAGIPINNATFTITPAIESIIKLKGRNSQSQIACVITTDKDTWGDLQHSNFKITFELNYRYYVESTLDILVSSAPR